MVTYYINFSISDANKKNDIWTSLLLLITETTKHLIKLILILFWFWGNLYLIHFLETSYLSPKKLRTGAFEIQDLHLKISPLMHAALYRFWKENL